MSINVLRACVCLCNLFLKFTISGSLESGNYFHVSVCHLLRCSFRSYLSYTFIYLLSPPFSLLSLPLLFLSHLLSIARKRCCQVNHLWQVGMQGHRGKGEGGWGSGWGCKNSTGDGRAGGGEGDLEEGIR